MKIVNEGTILEHVQSLLHQTRDDEAPRDSNGRKPLSHHCHPMRVGKELSFWSRMRGQPWRISVPRELCFKKDATSARGWVLKQGMSPSLLLHWTLPLMKPKEKTTIKKARERKILLGAGQRWKKKGSGQDT